MLVHIVPMVAVLLGLQTEPSVVVQGVVLDPNGKPLPNVDVAVAALLVGRSCPIVAQTASGALGAFRLEVPRQWFSRRATFLTR